METLQVFYSYLTNEKAKFNQSFPSANRENRIEKFVTGFLSLFKAEETKILFKGK